MVDQMHHNSEMYLYAILFFLFLVLFPSPASTRRYLSPWCLCLRIPLHFRDQTLYDNPWAIKMFHFGLKIPSFKLTGNMQTARLWQSSSYHPIRLQVRYQIRNWLREFLKIMSDLDHDRQMVVCLTIEQVSDFKFTWPRFIMKAWTTTLLLNSV